MGQVYISAGTERRKDVVLTAMRRHDVAYMSVRRHFNGVCLFGRQYAREVKRNLRKAEWNHVNNVIQEGLNQNNQNISGVLQKVKGKIVVE